MQSSARQHRATSTTADPPPHAALWTLPNIGFGLFHIASPSGMPAFLMLALFAAVCATPVVAALVDRRAIVAVWLAGSMSVVATVVIAVSSGSDESVPVIAAVPGWLAGSVPIIIVSVIAYILFIAALFMLRFVLRYLLRR